MFESFIKNVLKWILETLLYWKESFFRMIGAKASTLRGRYICLGVGSMIFAHIFINLGGLFAVIPLTGVPLPFLSYGGTYTLGLALSLTMVQRVAYETKTRKIKI